MTGQVKTFLDGNTNFYEFDTSYTSVNGIWLKPLEFMAIHDGTTLGLQTISLQGTELEEVIFADLDLIGSVGKYTVDPTTNSVIFIVDKIAVDTEAKAKNEITGMLIEYSTQTLEYFSTDALYTLESYSSNGTFLGSTEASSMGTLISKIYVLDGNLDVNNSTGYYVHKIRRALQVSA